MGKTGQLLVFGIVVAMVGTTLLLPGRQTIGAIQATGTAGTGLIKASEGR